MSGRQRANGRCKQGHPVVGENAIAMPNGKLACRLCHNEAAKRYYRKSISVEFGGSFRRAIQAISKELFIAWARFEAECNKIGLDAWNGLSKLLKLPLDVLGIDLDALKKYLEIVSGEKPGRRMDPLNQFLATYGRPEESKPTSSVSGEGLSDVQF